MSKIVILPIEKGKPVERQGRKATGLKFHAMAAGPSMGEKETAPFFIMGTVSFFIRYQNQGGNAERA
ncbi:hypothetical protein ACVLD2_002175 [Paenibacillus sp. PvR052]|nr:hypothetical protein [Paenibacillus sp. PvP091]MBP1171942.1 hypothetical protein [Paenibacillus sp. PvR098]MBP2438323.1 hypothetical protein [Paenibacillus sp. PvP052]